MGGYFKPHRKTLVNKSSKEDSKSGSKKSYEY